MFPDNTLLQETQTMHGSSPPTCNPTLLTVLRNIRRFY
ncbi:MAG: hypothetical protein K0R55_950 [Sporomusa sp.]|jgi:hypothetical protein|nr:hypothetical protein [Sporomusa sp.]